MEATKEKHAFTPGPWEISCIDGIKDSLMVGGGDDGSNIVADIRTMEDALYDAETDLFDGIQNLRSRAHVEGWSEDSVASIDNDEKHAKQRVDEIRELEKQANANALLIAAAPEAYDLLCKISNSDLGDIETAIQITLDAREILAKVDGGEG